MSHFNAGDTVIIVDDNRRRAEIGEYLIESVGRKFFYVRDSYGKAAFSLVDGFEKTPANQTHLGRYAYTPQDWELERKYRQLDDALLELGVNVSNLRRYHLNQLQTVLDTLREK